ncbi:MAG TPA: polysaccharide deacetylase family protein, partial [Pseudorhizobium sp.]|nr:polysaccharide deacetylase family protein [Pseudorhizobium sp.]
MKNIRRRGGKRNVIPGVLSASYLASRAGLLPARRGRGAIFTLHHVRPARQTFEANAHLEVTPEFLEAAIRQLRSDGYDFVGLDDIPARLRSSESKPFAAFTLDDGYHNNVEYALPVFERHDVPFTVFITRGFAERTHSLWWETLAELLPQVDHLEFDFGKGVEKLQLSSPPQVKAAFDRFVSYVWQKDETEAISEIDALSRRHGFDSFDLTHRLVMGREELLKLVAHPLATLGAHTVSHRAVSRLSDQDARFE